VKNKQETLEMHFNPQFILLLAANSMLGSSAAHNRDPSTSRYDENSLIATASVNCNRVAQKRTTGNGDEYILGQQRLP